MDDDSISAWQERCHALAVEKGWWPEKLTVEQREANRRLAEIAIEHFNLTLEVESIRAGHEWDPHIAVDAGTAVAGCNNAQIDDLARMSLVHSEVSEAVREIEGSRWPPYGRADEELADVVIRILDWCGAKGVSLEDAIRTKHAKNQGRPHRHGKIV